MFVAQCYTAIIRRLFSLPAATHSQISLLVLYPPPTPWGSHVQLPAEHYPIFLPSHSPSFHFLALDVQCSSAPFPLLFVCSKWHNSLKQDLSRSARWSLVSPRIAMSAPSSSSTGLPTEYTNLLNELNRTIHRERPRDILQFCANWFNKRLEEQRIELINHSSMDPRTLHIFLERSLISADSSLPQINIRRAQTETIYEDPFAPTSPRSTSGPPPASSAAANIAPNPSTLPPASPSGLSFLSQDPNPTTDFPPNYNLSRRTSVSAESLAPQSSAPRRTSSGPTKTPQQEARIRTSIAGNILFKNLDDEQTRDVLDAMTEKRIPKEGVTVIHQGDVGDFFYGVEEGTFDFYIRKPGQTGLGERVGGVGPGGSFGELALMYNAPRAASVVSTSPGILWALDRITFRRILMDVPSLN